MSVLPPLGELKPLGNPRLLGKTLAKNAKGGRVVVQLAAVHTYDCPSWRVGRRHGECDCGALEEWERFTK